MDQQPPEQQELPNTPAAAPETPAVPAPAAEPTPAVLELAALPWMQAQLEVGTAPTAEELAAVEDPVARRALAAAERIRVQNQEQLAEQQQQLEIAKQEQAARERALIAERADVLGFTRSAEVRGVYESELAKLPAAGEEPHPDDPAYPAFAARLATLEVLGRFLNAMAAEDQKAAQARADAEAQAQASAQQQVVARYIDQHAEDFEDPAIYGAVRDLVKRYNMPVPEAHRHVIALRVMEERGKFSDAQAESRAAARARVAHGGRSPSSIPALPEGASAAQVAEYFEKYPEAVHARYAEITRGGALDGFGGY